VVTAFTEGPAAAVNSSRGTDVLIQPDGKIIAAGSVFDRVRGNANFALVRHNQDGSPDASFGSGGKVTTDFFQGDDSIAAIALQPDGKIVAAGAVTIPSGVVFGVARYKADGALDLDFVPAGKTTVSFGPGGSGAEAITIQPDGKIIVAGFADARPTPNRFIAVAAQAALARFNSDGSLDTSFGDSGKTTGPDVNPVNWITAIALQPDGKIVIAGQARSDLVHTDFLLARYDTNGSVDPSFGTGGWVTTDLSGFGDFAGDRLLVLPNGKLVVSGTDRGSDPVRFAMVRYNSDGNLDSSFGSGGKVASLEGDLETACMQADGSIVLAGWSGNFQAEDFVLVRHNANGAIDSRFGTNGRVVTEFLGEERLNAVAVQPDGRIIAAGQTRSTPSNAFQFALARFVGSSAEFTLAITQPAVSAERGTKVRIPIMINRAAGFTGPVTIMPPEPTAAFKPKPVEAVTTTENSVVLKLKIKAGAIIGPHQVTFIGRSEDGGTAAVVVTVNVQ
jgi:uncharacterized delta-60 repeat protein